MPALGIQNSIVGGSGGIGASGPQTVLHFLITGQSNGLGSATFGIDTTPVSRGLMFNTGVQAGGSGLTSLVPLADAGVQTIAPTLAAWLLHKGVPGMILVSNVSKNGARIDAINQGTDPYNDSLAQVTAAKALIEGMGKVYRFAGICFIHGETDDTFNLTTYANAVSTLLIDYRTDIGSITGLTEDFVMYLTQHTGTDFGNGGQRSGPDWLGSTKLAAFNLQQMHSGMFRLVSPTYMHDLVDTVHMSCADQRWLGERFAKAVWNDQYGAGFTPFMPTSATLVDDTVVIDFQAPVGPIQLSVADVMFHPTLGFAFFDDSGSPPTVSSVTITGAAQITLQLSGVPTGGSQCVQYAGFDLFGFGGCPKYLSAHGNIVDSDPAASVRGYDLRNWLPNFNLALS
jgi:Carbohydrate esterase, sialic acid-specific acetylesterase